MPHVISRCSGRLLWRMMWVKLALAVSCGRRQGGAVAAQRLHCQAAPGHQVQQACLSALCLGPAAPVRRPATTHAHDHWAVASASRPRGTHHAGFPNGFAQYDQGQAQPRDVPLSKEQECQGRRRM